MLKYQLAMVKRLLRMLTDSMMIGRIGIGLIGQVGESGDAKCKRRWMAVMAGAKNRIPAIFNIPQLRRHTDTSAEDLDHGT